MRSDGSGFRDLTPNTIVNFAPKWSRDGKRIVFVRSFADGFSEDGNGEIATMAPDGGGVRVLTHTPGYETDPAWSPDRRQIVFSRIRANDSEDLYSMTRRRAARAAADRGRRPQPRRRPGRPTARDRFVSTRDGDEEEIYVIAGRTASTSPAHAQRQLRGGAGLVARRQEDRVRRARARAQTRSG